MILVSCKNCHKVYEKEDYTSFKCNKCNHTVRRRVKNSLQISLALVLTALFLFIPAMIYPMMEVSQLGVEEGITIIEGIISFLSHGDYFIAFVILTASVIIPLIKLLGLLFIFSTLIINTRLKNKTKIKIFYFIETIGKWSMIDIYVVAILASIVQLDEIFNIKGGIAATSFALVVVFTMIAAHRFDTRIIWDEPRENRE